MQLEQLIVYFQVIVVVRSVNINESLIRLLVESHVPHLRTSWFYCRDTTEDQKTMMRVTATNMSSYQQQNQLFATQSQNNMRALDSTSDCVLDQHANIVKQSQFGQIKATKQSSS